ncbi:MAG TPA: hypothetical protein VMV56_11020 [Williamwhitmania sp.]|nr:hypothetical protein [Williamwhitmania sp.]
MKARFRKSAGFVAILLFASFLTTTLVGKPSDKFTKSVSKTFPATENTYLRVDNKFGSVTVTNWDKPEIAIDVSIEVQTGSKQDAESTLNGITIRLNQIEDTVIATTIFDEKSEKIKGFFNMGQNVKEFSVNYSIKLPKYTNVIVSQRFGDVNIDELSGYASLSVKYGNLRIGTLSRGNTQPLNSIELAYSEGNVENINWGTFELKFSKLNITNSRAMVIMSKYSTIDIEKASSIVTKNKFDNLKVEEVKNLVGDGGYTDYRISTLTGKLSLVGKFGGLRVDEVTNSFELIDVNLEHAGVRLGMPSTSYKINADASFGNINLPDNANVNRISKNTSTHVDGVVGSDANAKATVKIQTKFGDINLDD